MVNLRYHIVSIAAVFLALAIGLALGSTFVDSVLVSNLESRVDQLQADTEEAIDRRADAEAARDEAEAARDEALASVDAARSERFEVEDLVRPYLPQGRLSDTTTLIVAPESIDTGAVVAIRARLAATDTQLGGVLWLSDDLRLYDPEVRQRIAEAFSLAGDSRNAVRRALRFLVPQALLRPSEAGSSRALDADVNAISDAGALDGFSRGFLLAPRTRTALTLLRDLGLVTHDGTGAVALHLLGGEGLRLVVVTDAAAAGLNEDFVFDLLTVIADDGYPGSGVIVEVPALDAAGIGYGAVLERVRLDPLLAASFSSVDGVDTFSGDLALLVALEDLPEIRHFSLADPEHGLGPS
ncbi:copper transporter [Candidatus Poriferisodalis sp.]|uniref:copper transporter n=1 Tax=Candidatus Poriferisodalis sp. TaxID=3101277 RepID=UPI003AF45D19